MHGLCWCTVGNRCLYLILVFHPTAHMQAFKAPPHPLLNPTFPLSALFLVAMAQ